MSLSLRLLGRSLGLLSDLGSSLLWSGGYHLWCWLRRLSASLGRLGLSLCLLGGSLGLRGNFSSGLLWA